MGAVNNAKQLRDVIDMIAKARAQGAEERECGQVPDETLFQGCVPFPEIHLGL